MAEKKKDDLEQSNAFIRHGIPFIIYSSYPRRTSEYQKGLILSIKVADHGKGPFQRVNMVVGPLLAFLV